MDEDVCIHAMAMFHFIDWEFSMSHAYPVNKIALKNNLHLIKIVNPQGFIVKM